ncbi:hypothetical protein PLICRDRAFT_170894 [Plicaturopsis crispa FD-325 SS-3]|nr:hypothetical protein PLICRDRAFT_170894 [Plicaturopsis crispa FD-325 SS-3]
MSHQPIATTLGALLVGGLTALYLSGAVLAQTVIYYSVYPTDLARRKVLVAAVWLLDLFHSGLVSATIWGYLIESYGVIDSLDYIPWTLALTVALTAIITFTVQCFFAVRIHRLSKGKWYITAPIVILALLRLCSACVSTGQMLHYKSFNLFNDKYAWVFTLGLATSSVVDILVAGSLCYFLRVNREGSTSSNLRHTLDMLMLYAVETGTLTCFVNILSMICWLAMPHNRIFLGIHFVISKLYANSFLASLNSRSKLREGSQSEDPTIPAFSDNSFGNETRSPLDAFTNFVNRNRVRDIERAQITSTTRVRV